MPIIAQTEQISIKRIPAVDCWRVIYDTKGNILIFERDSCQTVTANEVYCGTLEECNTHISLHGLVKDGEKLKEREGKSVTDSVEGKDLISPDVVSYIKNNPKGTLSNFSTGSSFEKTAESCWTALKSLLLGDIKIEDSVDTKPVDEKPMEPIDVKPRLPG